MTPSKAYNEFLRFYSSYNPDTERMTALAKGIYEKGKDKDVLAVKCEIIDGICQKAKIHLFRESPFFFEFSCGRSRYAWGGLKDGVGKIAAVETWDGWLGAYAREMKQYYDGGYVFGWDNPVGFDHHCLGYDVILEKGILGIIDDIVRLQKNETSKDRLEFYECTVNALVSLCNLALRFCDRAISLFYRSKNKNLREHYLKIAGASRNVPMKPPQSFYEALCCILFCREAIGSLEGIGVSTFGQLDRLVGGLYMSDIEKGVITRDEAKALIRDLLHYTEARFDKENGVHETSTTIYLGGCDADGRVVFNDLTRLILETVTEERTVGTKIVCRVSREHPEEFFDLIAALQAANVPTLAVQNDEVHIASRVRHGQDVRDARLYVGGGCHETVLAGTEVNTRADTFINPTRVLLDTMSSGEYPDFEAFYKAFLSEYALFYGEICRIKNKYEAMWRDIIRYPLYSATIAGCLESCKDVTEGGARYSLTSLSHTGTATLVDSLYGIKRLVYDEKKLTMSELCAVLSDNFEGNSELRRYVVEKIPKYGCANGELDEFSAKVLSDFAKNLPKLKNARGGDYMPAFYPHNIFVDLGRRTGATPDGRLSGTPLSRGCSPSEFIETASPLDIFHSIKKIDFTDYTDSFCCELTLPSVSDVSVGKMVVKSLLKAFIEVGGSTLQINMLDRDVLLDAKRNPELHRDLLVRICGFSEHFVTLDESMQDEVIGRAIRG